MTEQGKPHPWTTLKAEARAVWLETGLTPHQLAEQRNELLALLVESQTSIGGDWRARRDAAVRKARGAA